MTENFKMSIEYTDKDGKLHKTDTDLNTLKAIPKFIKTKEGKKLIEGMKNNLFNTKPDTKEGTK
jgi:hypothetical protein